MTHSEQNGFALIKKIHVYITLAILIVGLGINIGVSQTQLATKIDDKQARVIIKEELNEQLKHYGTDVDVKVLESKLETLTAQLKEVDKKIERLLRR